MDERTPLQFNEELHRQAPEESLYTVLMRKPFVAALALSLFCLLLLVAQSFEAAWTVDWTQIPQFELRGITVDPMGTQLQVQALGDLSLDLPGIVRRFEFLDSVHVDLEPFVLTVNGEYCATMDFPHQFDVDLRQATPLNVSVTVRDPGHTHVLQRTLDAVLASNPIDISVSGAVIVSRYGVPFRVPVQRTVQYTHKSRGDPASVEKVRVSYAEGLQFDIRALLFAQNLPVSLSLPETSWSVSLADCEGKHHDMCSSTTKPIVLDLEDGNNVSISALMTHLPTAMTVLCSDTNRSATDRIISRYLNGKPNTIFIEGHSDADTFIGRAVDHLGAALAIQGKPLDDKLVDSVQVHHVRLSVDGEFSGDLTVEIHLPQMLEIDASAVIGAQNIRGSFVLSHGGIAFGRIPIEEWTPTITSNVPGKYLVQVFFNHVPFEVLEAREAAIVSRELMFGGHSAVEYNATFDVDVISPVAQFFVSDISLEGDTILERS